MPGGRSLRIAARRRVFLVFDHHFSFAIILIGLALAALLLLQTDRFRSHRWHPLTCPVLHQTRGTNKDRRPKPDKINDQRCPIDQKMREETHVKRKNKNVVEGKFDASKDIIGPVPFFWGGGDEGTRGLTSHLDHRVEEYRQGLVKVVQGMDLIINRLEEASARSGTDEGDMPGAGVRRLATKLRRKLEKTPPCWQVNTDVLVRLLQPVPFVAGLPAPGTASSTACETTHGGYEHSSTSAGVQGDRADTGPAMVTVDGSPSKTRIQYCDSHGSGRGALDANGVHVDAERRREDASSERGAGEATDVFGLDPQSSEAEIVDAAGHDCAVHDGGDNRGNRYDGGDGEGGSADAEVLERRAAPVVEGPAATLAEALDGIANGGSGGQGDEEKQKSSGGTGFYSYDDAHQIFTHLLRDWTSEGDPVRAAVYDPLVQALDYYVGWQEVQAPGTAPTSHSVTSGTNCAHKPRRKHKQKGTRRRANVLVPGAGLGRLAAELAARGYANVHANEISLTMLASSYWLIDALRSDKGFSSTTPLEENGGIVSPCAPPAADCMIDCGKDCFVNAAGDVKDYRGNSAKESTTEERQKGKGKRGVFEFYPFLNDAMHNEMDGEARFRPALFPDPAGRAVLALASDRLSFQVGEFSSTYGAAGGPFEGYFDAVVTSFFIDTAPNVIEYVATIRRTLRMGGVWINCGPLQWHSMAALALSLDEMLALVAGSGFRLETVERLAPCAYRMEEGERSLRVDEFRPVFWVAILEGRRRE